VSAPKAAKDALWRLESITVTNFRGVLGAQTYGFAGLSALIWGENGVGKSTLALALEWTLFGAFPSQAFGAPRDNFMSPVGSGMKACKGEVAFRRGSERLRVRRDAEEGEFIVETVGKKKRAADAEALLQQLLGLDKHTFVRAVLLQQSKIRGLLLDEPKERTKALDRLLGMDDAEAMLESVRAKSFKTAAEAWREGIDETEAKLQSQHELLAEQYEVAEKQARTDRFLNQDLNALGLKARYADLSLDIARVGSKYGVDVDPLPPAEGVEGAKKASVACDKALRRILVGAELQKELVPVEKRLTSLVAARSRWNEVISSRAGAQRGLDALIAAHGDARTIAKRLTELKADAAAQDTKLRTASEVRALLAQARQYFGSKTIEDCPVCEQGIEAPTKVLWRLGERIEELTTKTVRDLEENAKKAHGAHAQESEVLKRMELALKALDAESAEVETERKNIMKVLAIAGLGENTVATELEKAIVHSQGRFDELARGVEAMVEDLDPIIERERAIREGLVPFLVARERVRDHQGQWDNAKDGYAAAEERAAALESLATDIESIRKALLAAKEEIVTVTLAKARPRAQELYEKLVQHSLFDRLEVKAARKANKVEYAFEVSSSTLDKSGREARLVLSDGQMTATALALFFALAEASQHALDLLYVDDPTQNLDHRRKEAMAKVIADLGRRKQIVVSTQDEDFVTLLRDAGFEDGSVFHHIDAWDRSPEVRTTMPRTP
jgi:DNA repair exonuclease SbcCD ATPase subunit